jgi:hypothetical protein
MPKTLNLDQKQKLIRKVKPFILKEGTMYRMGQDNKMHKCSTTSKAHIILKKLHEGVAIGHFAVDITAKKNLDVGYWWLTLFKDIHEFYRSCNNCHIIKGLKTKSLAKLVTKLLEEPFMKWVLDFIGPIKLGGKLTRNINVLVVTDYATNCVESKATNIAVSKAKFLYEYILTRFGCLLTIVTNQGVHIINDIIKYMT